MNKDVIIIKNLAGAFTGTGFARKGGRHPLAEDCAFMRGPLDIVLSRDTGKILDLIPSRNDCMGDIIDGSNLVATSAWLDSHTHALFAGDRTHESFRRWAGASYAEIDANNGGIHYTVAQTNACGDDALLDLLRQRLRAMRRCGAAVVEVKSGYADSPEGELRLLMLLRRLCEEPDLPRVCPTFLGLHALPPEVSEVDYCDAMISALDVVAAEGLASCADAFPENGFFSRAQAERFLITAQRKGLRVKVHADEITDMGAAAVFARMGAISVDHLQRINPAAVEVLAESPAVGTLLPATSFYMGIPYANARSLIDTGVRVALATDYNPGTAPQAGFHFTQLLAAAQLKMTPAEILCACTCNAAAALGMESQYGTLTPGMMGAVALWPADDLAAGNEYQYLERLLLGQIMPFHTIVNAVHRFQNC